MGGLSVTEVKYHVYVFEDGTYSAGEGHPGCTSCECLFREHYVGNGRVSLAIYIECGIAWYRNDYWYEFEQEFLDFSSYERMIDSAVAVIWEEHNHWSGVEKERQAQKDAQEVEWMEFMQDWDRSKS
jgi:hypothetical protein